MRHTALLILDLPERLQHPAPIARVRLALIDLVFVFLHVSLSVHAHIAETVDQVVAGAVMLADFAFHCVRWERNCDVVAVLPLAAEEVEVADVLEGDELADGAIREDVTRDLGLLREDLLVLEGCGGSGRGGEWLLTWGSEGGGDHCGVELHSGGHDGVGEGGVKER